MSFYKKPNIIIAIILFLIAFLPGLLYMWFAGKRHQLVL